MMSNGHDMLTFKGKGCVLKIVNHYRNPPAYIYDERNMLESVLYPGEFITWDQAYCRFNKVPIDDWYYMWEGSKKKHKLSKIFE
jgi:hypothetical protein